MAVFGVQKGIQGWGSGSLLQQTIELFGRQLPHPRFDIRRDLSKAGLQTVRMLLAA